MAILLLTSAKKEGFQGRAIWAAIFKDDLIKKWQIYNDNNETRKKLNLPIEDQK
jgi:hypothetical protein